MTGPYRSVELCHEHERLDALEARVDAMEARPRVERQPSAWAESWREVSTFLAWTAPVLAVLALVVGVVWLLVGGWSSSHADKCAKACEARHAVLFDSDASQRECMCMAPDGAFTVLRSWVPVEGGSAP